MKKMIGLLTAGLLVLALLVGCGGKVEEAAKAPEATEKTEEPKLKSGTYARDNDDNFIYDRFTIRIDAEKSTYEYYETLVSSFIGIGEYSVDGDILKIVDERPGVDSPHKCVNLFRIEEDRLVFIGEGSDNFMYIKLEDGDVFEFSSDQ